MKNQTQNLKIIITGILILFIWACNPKPRTVDMKPPVAEKSPKELTIHDDTRVDNYLWMRLTDEQKNAEAVDKQTQKVLDYLNAENAYTNAVMNHTEAFQKKLFEEIIGRIKQDDESVPVKRNGYFYYTRYEKGNEYPLYCRKKGNLEAKEEIMLNVNLLAKGHDFFQVVGVNVSEDSKTLAYGVDTVSRRRYTIYFKNLETGELLADQISNTTGGVTWAHDNKTVFYSTKDPVTLRSDRINRYVLGSNSPVEVYYEKDETFGTFVSKTKSKKYLVIGSSQTLSTEYRILDASDPTGEFRIVQNREKDHEYHIVHYEDHFYIRTNKDGALNFKLMRTSINKLTKENWTDVIPHRNDVLLQGFEIFKDYLVVSERIKGLTNLRLISWDGSEDYFVDFGEETYLAWISANPEFDTDQLRYIYNY